MSKKLSRTDDGRCPVTGRKSHEPAIDPRAAHSRAAIRHAFLSLILERGYEATDVRAICARAGVSRTTFYAHFADKDALKRAGVEHMRRELEQGMKSSGSGALFDFCVLLFEHARDHLHLFRALAGSRGADIAQQALRELIRDFVQRDIQRAGRLASAPSRRLAVDFYAGALFATLISWLERGARQSPLELAALCQQLGVAGLGGKSKR